MYIHLAQQFFMHNSYTDPTQRLHIAILFIDKIHTFQIEIILM